MTSTETPTSEVLYRAADLIEERGWVAGSGWLAAERGVGGLCIEGGIMSATGIDMLGARLCPAYTAVMDYLDQGPLEKFCDGLFMWNDAPDRTAAEVLATLRAAAVIEAAKENADVREAVTSHA